MTKQVNGKNNQARSFVTYVLSLLIASGLMALVFAASYPSPGELPVQKSRDQALAATAGLAVNPPINAASAPISSQLIELDSRLKELEVAQKTLYSTWLDGQRKTIDWWLAFLAVMTAVLALSGAFIPYLMGRKDKELITQLLKEADKAVSDTKTQLGDVKTAALEVARHRDAARADADAIVAIRHAVSGQDQTPEKKNKLAQAAKSVKEDSQASQVDKLRAEAVQAAAKEDAEKAYTLWAAVTALDPTDAVAKLNTGYWAQIQAKRDGPNNERFWLHEAARHYSQLLDEHPDKHEAANNWGSALNSEAKSLASTDLAAARALWSQAGQRYAQALKIKPDKHEAANNWGIALNAEATSLAAIDLPIARDLWFQAGQRYAQALKIKPDKHETAHNWGVTLNAEANALVDENFLAARALWLQAGQHYEQALEIKPDKHETANNWGITLNAEAKALAGKDLLVARALWLQAGQRYEQALRIKPDKHEAVNNYCIALLDERQAVLAVDANEADALLERAIKLLLDHAQLAPDKVAYNLACCFSLKKDVVETLYWLRRHSDAGNPLTQAAIRKDKDFDGVRLDRRFVAWFNNLEK